MGALYKKGCISLSHLAYRELRGIMLQAPTPAPSLGGTTQSSYTSPPSAYSTLPHYSLIFGKYETLLTVLIPIFFLIFHSHSHSLLCFLSISQHHYSISSPNMAALAFALLLLALTDTSSTTWCICKDGSDTILLKTLGYAYEVTLSIKTSLVSKPSPCTKHSSTFSSPPPKETTTPLHHLKPQVTPLHHLAATTLIDSATANGATTLVLTERNTSPVPRSNCRTF